MRKIFLLLSCLALFASLLSASARAASWFDKSQAIFLPPELSSKLGARSAFPVFWWNFVVYEFTGEKEDWDAVARVCKALKSAPASLVSKVACEQNVTQFEAILDAWARDYPLRHERPDDAELSRLFSESLATASLPIDNSLMRLLRKDPFGSHKELQDLLAKRMRIRLTQKNGYYYDPKARRVVIPVQFSNPPQATAQTRQLLERLPEGVALLGPHASNIENESQVMKDVGIVSLVGAIVLVLCGLLIVASRRTRLLYLVPPVLLSTAVAAGVTIGIFGSIHGLTLAFGTAIIGLAIDYGLHSALNQKYEGNWRANFAGVGTTIVALLVIMLSSIPLLRQMMVFSIIGLGAGFLTFFALHRRYPEVFSCEPFEIRPRTSRFKLVVIGAFLLSAAVAVFTLRPSFDLRQFDYQEPRAAELRAWLYRNVELKAPLLQVSDPDSLANPLDQAHEQLGWAQMQGIQVENVAPYLPPVDVQRRNLATWTPSDCARLKQNMSDVERNFFAPFVAALKCESLSANDLTGETQSVPAYVQDFSAQGRLLSLWLPKTDAEAEKIKSRYSDAMSLKEVASIFPQTLARELKWMVPLAFALAVALLGFYYRRVSYTALSLVPFFSGLGLYALVAVALKLDVSFVSLIGLVMIFGFSIDYGIFATDLVRDQEHHSAAGVWTSLSLAALTNAAGFAPLLFCKHPVLTHLGQTLVYGTVGTYLGAIWGIPGIRRFIGK